MKTTISAPENKQIEIKIVSKEFEVTKAIHEKVLEKTTTLEKFIKHDSNITFTLGNVKENKIATVVLHTKKRTIKASEVSSDLYDAIDKVSKKIKIQLIKLYKANKMKKMKLNREKNIPVKVKKIIPSARLKNDESIKPMFKEEALLQVQLLGLKTFHYIDAETFKPATVKNKAWKPA